MNDDRVYIVEVLSGSTDHGTAFVFNSVWSDEKLAVEYCQKRFKGWDYQITEVWVNTPS